MIFCMILTDDKKVLFVCINLSYSVVLDASGFCAASPFTQGCSVPVFFPQDSL